MSQPAQYAAVLAFELDEPREQRLDRQAVDVAGVNPGDQRLAETQLEAQLDALGLLNQQRIGACINREAIDLFAEDDAAGARATFEHDERRAAPVELIRRGKSRDAAPDHDDVNSGAAHR